VKPLKPISTQRPGKKQRELQVLYGLVEYYISTGKPVGSNTLKGSGFQDLSSATIRNYFMNLEKNGFLEQQHSSSGRIPTNTAYQAYAKEHLESGTLNEESEKQLRPLRTGKNREISAYLQEAAELLAKVSGYATFLSAPRFDHDFISDLKIVAIDQHRCLCVVITDFGVIKTEVLHTDHKLSAFSIKRLEAYFHWRLTDQDEPNNLDEEEIEIAQKFYNEVMLRYIVGYSNFSNTDLYWTGFSHLLNYPDFNDAVTLTSGLALFENPNSMRHLLRECCSKKQLICWIGDELSSYSPTTTHCSVVAIPYYINQSPVGAIGILGPTRLPYRELFGIIRIFSQYISESLTKDVYKHKISYRQPQSDTQYLEKEETAFIQKAGPLLLEDKSL
jgi:heat-inducible transcriptional repressor